MSGVGSFSDFLSSFFSTPDGRHREWKVSLHDGTVELPKHITKENSQFLSVGRFCNEYLVFLKFGQVVTEIFPYSYQAIAKRISMRMITEEEMINENENEK